ncbi:hypothetical protein M422DRAFT_161837 [Sphaerobolus stellatus SS14]|nr:hypothetical protein M422DRAFT_161837 [Sphaerobolus stellatus SS14]
MGGGLGGALVNLFDSLTTYLWDTGLSLLNLITPKRKKITALWPEFVPRKDTDSRSACPFLNALCNHGVLPHDGRNFTFKEMGDAVNTYYNFSPSFCYFVCNYIAKVLKRKYTDKLDLSDINVHNGIEHDGSLTRRDSFFQPDQSYPDEELIKGFLESCADDKKMTAADVSRALSKRFSDSKKNNGQFSLQSIHLFFGASNASTLLIICGGEIEDIKTFLLEERAPDGWSSKMRKRFGLTMASFNSTTMNVLLGIDPAWKKAKRAA